MVLGLLVLLIDQVWPWMVSWHLHGSSKVWGGGHHLNRWPPVPEIWLERPNLTHHHMQNWAKQTAIGPLTLLSDLEWCPKTCVGPARSEEVAYHLNKGPPVPGTCPERPNLTRSDMQNWVKQTALGPLVLLAQPWILSWHLYGSSQV